MGNQGRIIANGISPDHYGLFAIIENTTTKKSKKADDIFIRDYKNANIPALRETLSLFDPNYLRNLHIGEKFRMFQGHLTNCIEMHVSYRK